MGIKFTGLKLITNSNIIFEGYSYDLFYKYKKHLSDKPTLTHQKTIVKNGSFDGTGNSKIIRINLRDSFVSLYFIIKFKGKKIAKEKAEISKKSQSFITEHKLKGTHGSTEPNPEHQELVYLKVEKKKFIIICGGRGMGDHNQGDNFLNCAKYHIEDIKNNVFPGIPRFDPSTCEIVTPQDAYNMGGYTVFIEKEGTKESSSSSHNKTLDGYYNKPVPKGEIHRIDEFSKVFDNYKSIKYLAYFGHSWSNEIHDGFLLIGDRNTANTNLLKQHIPYLNKSNVLNDAQLRFFGCRSSYSEGGSIKPIAELFAQHFKNRECYGWASSGGSVFTDEPEYGRTGKNPKVDPNIRPNNAVDSNREKTWLTANGKPPGWKKFKK